MKNYWKRYGDVDTHFNLTGKALWFYDGTDPISIYETETDDGYRYTLDFCGEITANLTEPELVNILTDLHDTFDC